MRNLYCEADAEAAVAGLGVDRPLALCVYTTRLLGSEPRLVLHGGGNTSVKTAARDLLGREVEVLHVKGTGADMAVIEPRHMPAVRLEPLRELCALEALTDEAMVNAFRCNLLESGAPTPSVETLLHAFLPQPFVNHTHANAVLSLTDQPDGQELCRKIFGTRATVVPYIAPGFALAKAAFEAHRCNPGGSGMILLKHGIFSWGETAREAYDRMIELVSLAEARLAARPRRIAAVAGLPRAAAPPAAVAPILRGLTCLRAADGSPNKPFIACFRGGPAILEYVNGRDLERYAQAGVVTPDHAIRTKPRPLILDAPAAGGLDAFAARAKAAVDAYAAGYRAYFERHNAGQASPRIPLDPMPRVVLVRGLGLFALGRSAAAARVAADLAEAVVDVIAGAESIGRYEPITEPETFDMEYWPLEQAKLGKAAEPAMGGRVVVVTGGAGTIGFATGRAFARLGAEIAPLDLDGAAAEARAGELGGLGVACDVTKADEVRRALDLVCETFGGIDAVVSNAGSAPQGRIGEVDDRVLRESFELNFFAHQNVASAAVAVMRRQGLGGALLFIVSKQAVNPGRDFGPYGLPKAATLALLRQYAVDYGADGIRSNGVNADRVRSGLLTGQMIRSRAAARGVSEKEYLAGNLLGREVTADDVAAAFVSLALAPSTTGAVLTVDGGNIAAALR